MRFFKAYGDAGSDMRDLRAEFPHVATKTATTDAAEFVTKNWKEITREAGRYR